MNESMNPCVLYFAHLSIWDKVSTYMNGSMDAFSSLPLTPPEMFPKCLDITFHTSKQEATFPTFKTGLLPTHGIAGLVNSPHTGHTNNLPYSGFQKE